MAELEAKDVAAKQRILQHMNQDHQDSLVRYLEYFCHVPSFSARQAHLANITFDSLFISTGSTSFEIPIRPPMITWSDARARLVALDAQAVTGLNRSDITVKEYRVPRGFGIVTAAATISAALLFSLKSNFSQGSFIYDHLLVQRPDFAKWCLQIRSLLLAFMFVVHTGEAFYMERTRLRKHTVPRFSMLWWKWILGTYVEGAPSFKRFDMIVHGEATRRANAKH